MNVAVQHYVVQHKKRIVLDEDDNEVVVPPTRTISLPLVSLVTDLGRRGLRSAHQSRTSEGRRDGKIRFGPRNAMSALPRKQTSFSTAAMSALCQKRTCFTYVVSTQ
jgi:hypothetical protein